MNPIVFTAGYKIVHVIFLVLNKDKYTQHYQHYVKITCKQITILLLHFLYSKFDINLKEYNVQHGKELHFSPLSSTDMHHSLIQMLSLIDWKI